MCRVNRQLQALAAAAIATLALTPLSADAATPSPSPSLDKVLAPPPSSDFAELTTGVLHGQFDAHDWATTNSTGSAATETETTLKKDGFVDGYGKEWGQASAGHAMIEAVMAFTGGKGARSALTAIEASDKADSNYKHANTISGIDNYYGAHFADTQTNTFVDLYVFVKGNDIFFVVLASGKDDVLTVATNQTKTQFDSAPASTIPTSQWPENIANKSSSFPVVPVVVVLAIVLAVVVVGVVLATRRRGGAMPAMAGGAGAIQLSEDGNYWWDGQTWRDSSREVPPTAQRSFDGVTWWDGRSWRPVPPATEPGPPPTG